MPRRLSNANRPKPAKAAARARSAKAARRGAGLTHVHKIAAEWLRRYARGSDRARTKDEILAGLARVGLRLDARRFDKLMGEMTRAGMAVGSSSAGFFWMTAKADFDLARAYITGRFKPMRQRADAIAAQELRRFPPRTPLLDAAAAARAVRIARGSGGRRRRRS